ncbi:complement resistance protein TraT [Marinomonas sp. 2405UD68-3]|uniref:complement resistance protein TraT n=1 Tax=Marinomonas sp. 2405UD68-3 TaxID=3391835 RepID=UPI0039C8CB67
MKLSNIFAKTILIAGIAASLVGCSAINTSLNKQDLTVDSRLSQSIVLEPLAPSKRVVYARIRDVSGNNMRVEMQKIVNQQLQSEGFIVTNDPETANLMLNATIISAGKTTADEANSLLSSGYKGGFEGAAVGAGITSATGGSGSDAAKAGLLLAAAGFLADSLIEDTYYTFVMDVEMRERALSGDTVSNSTRNVNVGGGAYGNNANVSINNSSVVRGDGYNWIIYKTRIVTTANKINLDIQEALPAVQQRTALSVSELML